MENTRSSSCKHTIESYAYTMVGEFNRQTTDHAITCGIEDIRSMAVRFTIFNSPPRPCRPGEINPVIHDMKGGSIIDVAYWLDHQVHLDTLRQWIMYNEMLENSDAGEYVSAPSLECFNEHPGNIIRPQVIEEINVRIGRMCEYIQSDEIKVRNLIRSIVEDSNRFRGQLSENRISDGQPAQQPGE